MYSQVRTGSLKRHRGGTRLESLQPQKDSSTLHSIRKALNGFLWRNCSGRTEQIDGYTFCMLLLVEQQHQKLLIDNYSRESREGDKARGDDAFQEDIRFGWRKIYPHRLIQSVSSAVCQESLAVLWVCAIQILSLYFRRFNTFQGHPQSPVIDYYKQAVPDW